MASSNKTFMEEHKDFVLKLRIKATDGTSQIRRVRLPKIADDEGNVSYDELVGLVVTFTFPDGSPENYNISLTYFDVDEDPVTIATPDELVDAIEQYSDKKLLRITTEVKLKTKSAQAGKAPGASGARTDRGTSTTREQSSLQPQIHNVLESFVGILATAVTSLQEGLTKPIPPPSSAPRSSPSSSTTSTAAAEEVPSGTAACSASAKVEENTEEASTSIDTEANQGDRIVTEEAVAENEEAKEGERPFIHGRHTCDSCLTTPIVGKRFHANNLPDYDLCGKCVKNYKGKEIKFESVVLDRDRAFQERWNRRRDKIQKVEARKANRHCGRGARRQWGPGARGRGHGQNRQHQFGMFAAGGQVHPPPPHHVPPYPPPPGCPLPPPPPPGCPPPPFMHGGMPPAWAHVGAHVGPHMAPHFNSSGLSQFDTSLKEAIRRSLQDIGSTEDDIFAEGTPTAQVEAAANPDDEEKTVVPASAPAEEEIVVKTEEVSVEDPGIVVKPEVDLEQPSQPVKSVEEVDEKVFEDLMETASVDSEKMVEEDEDMAKKPAAVVHDSSSKFEKTDADESFASDAVGNGDVAEAMGATLDMVAGMISDMLSEADTQSQKSAPEKNKTEDHMSFASGALILDEPESANKADDDSSEKDENGWHVVGGTEEELANTGDQIARATEMLGSALFNSDMKSPEDEEENVSTLSDSFSVPSTVPSISAGTQTSQVDATRHSRWASQLSTLRELGFENESLCVEIIERLEAANIGVDSNDEISVTQVVNAILEQN